MKKDKRNWDERMTDEYNEYSGEKIPSDKFLGKKKEVDYNEYSGEKISNDDNEFVSL
jgi:hypothetical protein